jgi:hypothetical protein
MPSLAVRIPNGASPSERVEGAEMPGAIGMNGTTPPETAVARAACRGNFAGPPGTGKTICV